ncbi:uncharacterized protein TA09650 [Theileria annulata]|uniref:Pinin/SDK/MemA protein domain-containing protein n=1 Tax=Theileria annulata TaxID=5874 RepID=Q4UJ40_THEAN|nr:uncharacterized protein TA09650 [Theileria annulata]CAI72899.1 hypothetical protein, conserved [Theileria annulata]|eukprot:XP_953577.1 hypothetical protein, conserved [Theileria annulata]
MELKDEINILQDNIRIILQEKKQINLTLKKLSNQLINFNNGDSNVLLSNKVLNNNSFDSKRKLKDEENYKEYEPEKRPRIEDDNETIHRHKRLMKVGLFGYLLKAKDALVKEKDNQLVCYPVTVLGHTANHQPRKGLLINSLVIQLYTLSSYITISTLHSCKISSLSRSIKSVYFLPFQGLFSYIPYRDTKLEEKQKEQSTLLQKDIQEQYDINKNKLEILNKELLEKQTQLMRMKLKEHYESMGNFIATSTQPTIFWIPFKFNHHLNTLRNTTKNFINKKIELILNTNYYD